MTQTNPVPSTAAVRFLDGRDSILHWGDTLEGLAERWGQTGAMHWIGCFLNEERLRWKQPLLVVLSEGASDTVFGAALVFEYRPFGLRTGFYVTDDPFALQTVITAPGRRDEVIRLVVEALMGRGAQLVACSYDGGDERGEDDGVGLSLRNVQWARRLRTVPRDLELQESYEETLAQIGRSTRTNLRRYRRRLERKMACEFIPAAAATVKQEELEQINRESLNPVKFTQFQRRWMAASEHPHGFLSGLQTADGRWLSFVGGWREGNTAVLNWQVNAVGYEKDSLSTAMRAFLLEYEIGRGTERIVFDGGTPTFLSHSLRKRPVFDLLVQRTSVRAKLVVLARRAFGTPEFALPALYGETPEWASHEP